MTARFSSLNRVASQSYKIDKTLIPPMQTGITYGPVSYTHLDVYKRQVFFNDKKDLIPKIEETEAKIDQLHKAVKAYAEDLSLIHI